jgi:hypothetical protein
VVLDAEVVEVKVLEVMAANAEVGGMQEVEFLVMVTMEVEMVATEVEMVVVEEVETVLACLVTAEEEVMALVALVTEEEGGTVLAKVPMA